MAAYWNLHTKIWTDPDFQELSKDGKLVFMYLLTNKARTLGGIYPITMKTIGDETDIGREGARLAIEELEAAEMIKYDRAHRVVWVINAVKYIVNIQASPTKLINVAKNLTAVEESPLVEKFLEAYSHLKIPYHNNTPSGQPPDPMPTPPIPPLYPPCESESESESETESENERERGSLRGRTKPAGAAGQCYRLFEKEFGRPLSPLEAEQIQDLGQQHGFDLVREALRRAVAQGKRNIRYVQRILQNWRDANLRTLTEVLEYEELREKDIAAKKAAAGHSGPGPPGQQDPANLLEAQRKKREEKLGACLGFIRVNYNGRLPPRDKATEIARGYGEEIVDEVLRKLYGSGDG